MVEELHELLNTKEEKEIKNLIYTFREKEVMLDSDLAILFETNVSLLNRQVKRNANRFPEDFCFQLKSKETNNLRCQNGTFNQRHLRSQFVTSNKVSSLRRYNSHISVEQAIKM